MITERSLKLFHKAAKEVPAYKSFLADNGINPADIKTVKDFEKLPLTSKKKYLVPNKLTNLVWKESLQNPMVFCSTSGSTGEPYYFPRNEQLSEQYSYLIEDFLNNSSYGKGSTLVLNGLGMGVWIGGIITHRAFEIAGARMKAPIAILPTGYNKQELLKAMRRLSPNFDQTIIIGYPPFIKELLEEASAEMNLAKLHLRILTAAEAFTETFRNYICQKAGIKHPLVDTLNIYGTADIGAMAYETPLSILARRLIVEDPELFKEAFRQFEKTPTLAQYNPNFVEFEEAHGELALTSDSAIPLVRYAIGDHGGVIEYDEMAKLLAKYKINLDAEARKHGVDKTVRKYPFVFVYERTDLAATLQGIIIYPEFIKEGLLDPSLATLFTERFTMSTKSDIDHNQFLQINVELQAGVAATDTVKEKALKAISDSLVRKSSEFAEVAKSRSSEALLQVILWEKGHPRYFAPGTKQKWVEKS